MKLSYYLTLSISVAFTLLHYPVLANQKGIASCADLQSRCSFEFLSGGEYHPEGFGMWRVKLDSAGGYYIAHHASGKVKEYGTFSLTTTENNILWEFIEAVNFEKLDVPKRHGVPDEAQYTFEIRHRNRQRHIIKIWGNDALENEKISRLIKQIKTIILKYSGQRAVLF